MAFVPLPNGIKVTWVFDVLNKPVTVTVYVTSPTAISDAELTNAINGANSVWANGMKPAMSNNLRIVQTEALDVSIPDGQKKVSVFPPGELGAIATEAMSNNVAMLLSLRTDRTGRSRRGRVYLPGLAVSGVDGNTLTSTQQLLISTLGVRLRTDFESRGLQLVVASYWSGGLQRTTALATAVTSQVIPEKVATQRRRL